MSACLLEKVGVLPPARMLDFLAMEGADCYRVTVKIDDGCSVDAWLYHWYCHGSSGRSLGGQPRTHVVFHIH